MVGEYLMLFQNNRQAVNLLLQKIKLCSFANLISQTFSDTAVILAITVSKRCTQDLPIVTVRKARVLDFCFPTIRPFQQFFFKEYVFSAIVDFGVPFSVNFFSSLAFLGF